jgi:hypothetical protein
MAEGKLNRASEIQVAVRSLEVALGGGGGKGVGGGELEEQSRKAMKRMGGGGGTGRIHGMFDNYHVEEAKCDKDLAVRVKRDCDGFQREVSGIPQKLCPESFSIFDGVPRDSAVNIIGLNLNLMAIHTSRLRQKV